MKTIAIFGGTGMTGECAVKHALSRGFTVKVLYRNEATVPDAFKENVVLVKGDVTCADDVKKVIDGVDAVCVVLGTRNKLEPTTEMSRGTQNIIDSMKHCGVDRISVCLSTFLLRSPSEVPPIFTDLNNEHKRMLEIVKNSGLNYVCVLPPHISSDPPGEVDISHDKPISRQISKYDLGKFLIESLVHPEYFGTICCIANKV
uniref:Putative nmra-like family n=1 Tax=Tabanus bromius TaxID=304241 RepID=A0A0K8TQW4_TABBR